MKVLYIGYYKEKSDWGTYATNNILALDKAGLDVTCKSLNLSGHETPLSIKKLEEKDIQEYDICIQHVFPEHMVGSQKFKKNIGILGNEFVTIEHSCWVETLNQLDEIWVPSLIAKELMPKNLYDKVKVVPHCFDKSNYTRSYPDVQIPLALNKFKFYTAVNSSDKNLEHTLRCFHSEFDKSDQVSLIIQMTGDETPESFHKRVEEIKSKISLQQNLVDYIPDIIIPKEGDSQSLYQLHHYGDCFITPSNQRCLPSSVFDSLCLGSTPIILEGTDATEYVGKETSVKSVYEIIEKNDSPVWKDIYNSKNFVFKPCEKTMRLLMREVYEKWLDNPMIDVEKKREGLKKAEKFSLESVGKIAKEMLNE